MIRPAFAVLALLLAVIGLSPAAAAQDDNLPAISANTAPALRASVTVSGDVVRIGDLIENAGAAADVPIFRSPDLGTRGIVSTASIVAAIRPHQLIDIDTRGLAEVVVTRASRSISVQEMSASIALALSGQFGLGDAGNITVYYDRDVRTVQAEAGALGPLQVLNLSYDPRSTRFDAIVDLPSSAALHRQPLRLTGTAIETVPAVAVNHPVARGEVLKESDLVVLRRPKSEGGGITTFAEVAGLAARHELRPDQPLHTADLVKPDVIARNDTVTISYRAPGFSLTLQGQAQASGALGDTIGVLNAESKRVVQGVITAPGRVTVNAMTTRVVENAPAPAVVPSAQRSE